VQAVNHFSDVTPQAEMPINAIAEHCRIGYHCVSLRPYLRAIPGGLQYTEGQRVLPCIFEFGANIGANGYAQLGDVARQQ
jgi:hypothetical protein